MCHRILDIGWRALCRHASLNASNCSGFRRGGRLRGEGLRGTRPPRRPRSLEACGASDSRESRPKSRPDGGDADPAQVDALDEQAVEKHASAIVKKVGAIEISFNSTGIPQQGILMTGTVANLTGGRVAELGTESQLEAPR